MLMRIDRPGEMLEAYRAALEISPNRFRSHYGTAPASHSAGDTSVAAYHQAQLVPFYRTERPALREAQAFMANNRGGCALSSFRACPPFTPSLLQSLTP
jgi:hypothetical protein